MNQEEDQLELFILQNLIVLFLLPFKQEEEEDQLELSTLKSSESE